LDSNRFDNFTRLMGAGTDRRRVLRMLLGGAGALAATGVTRHMASAAACETPADCGAQPDSCTEWLCVDRVCQLNGGCPANELCCPAQGGSCAECCDNSDCPAGAPICYNPGDPTNAYCVGCVGDGDCTAPCTSCVDNVCTAYAAYCADGDYCYNTMEGECCTDSECGDEFCIDQVCTPCPSGTEYCESGDYCYSKMIGECCTDSECGNEVCTDRHCCPPGDKYCPDGDYCYTERTGGCCPGDDCGPCQSCHDGFCGGDCSQSEECCNGECVPFDTCCQSFGDTCGVLDVTSAGGTPDDRQYDCCDGLLCCFGQSTNVCGECCGDGDCKDAPGGVCNAFQCEYPTCEGKYEACSSDSDCCHGLKCRGGVCKHPHKPHHPTTPTTPVQTLPSTGVKGGGNDSADTLGMTLAVGAAALLAAKHLRQTSTEEASDEA